MISTNTIGKTDYYATNSTAPNVTMSCDDLAMIYEVTGMWVGEQTEPAKPRAERTAHRYIDHLWPVERITITTEELDRGCSEPPYVKQMPSTYG